jgi:ribose/xylose/arabinose/galactoside ABC-type transport system permease subunit
MSSLAWRVERMRRIGRQIFSPDSAAAVASLIVVVVVFSILNPRFLTPLNINGVIVRASISAIVGMGMTIVIAMRGLDLSVGSVMGFSSIVAALLLNSGAPIPLIVLATLAVGLALGLGNGLLITLLGLPSFVATLATLSMILGTELMITQGRTVPIHSSTLNTLVAGNIGGVPGAAVIAVVVFGVVWVSFYRLPFGRHLAAIGGDARAAVSAGINVNRVTLGVFMLVGMCAALAGLMTAAQLQNADSTIGLGAELTAIATVVVGGTSLAGGRGNLFGTCCAAVLLATIKTGLNVVNVSSLYEDLVFGTILIVALMIDGRRRATHGKGMIVV